MEQRTSTLGSRASARASHAAPLAQDRYVGSRFRDVWAAVTSDPYLVLPEKRVGVTSALDFLAKNVYRAARRTLEARDDLLPAFEKLVHPVGICLRGTWRIRERTHYTGLFRTGAEGLIIARASDGVGENRPGRLRLLGLAGKLYPTTDPDHPSPLETANFVTLENLGGSYTRYFADATLSTDLLPLRPHPGLLPMLPTGLLAGSAFALADRALHPAQPLMRQLYPIAELGEELPSRAVAPVVMRLVGSPRNRHIERADLREELRMSQHPDGIRFEIQVADSRSYFAPHGFRRIGEIHFTESCASYTGDHRLHFAHAPYRPMLDLSPLV